MAKAKQTRRMIAMALAAAVAMSSVPVVAFAEDDTTVSGEGTTESPRVTLTVETKTDSNTGDTTHTETKVTESKETSENTTTVSVVTESTTSVTDATGAVTSTSQSSERVVSETTTGGSTSGSSVEEGTETIIKEKDGQSSPVEVPVIGEGVEPDHYDENGDPVFKNTDEADLPDPEVDGDEQQGENDPNYDYTVKEETPREVEVTITDWNVSYDEDKDVYEGEENLQFLQPVGKGTNLGGAQLHNKYGDTTTAIDKHVPIQETVEGYDYTPYGFIQNDVTHLFYIRADENGDMVDADGNAIYYYDEVNDSYTRKLPDEVEIYDIAAEKIALYYKITAESGEESFDAILGESNVEKIYGQGNSMLAAMMDTSKTHSDEMWETMYDDLLDLAATVTPNKDEYNKAAMDAFKTKYPDFFKILDMERMIADYQNGGLTEEIEKIYDVTYYLFKKQGAIPENAIPAYCVDLNTGTISGSWYDLMNMEDVGYYSTERTEENGFISDADRIKAIAMNGYWGTTEGAGSLPAMKAFFQARLDEAAANGQTLNYTKEDIDKLTQGDALTITQHSIWRFGNSLDGAYMDGYTYHYYGGSLPNAERDVLIDKFVEYFTTMPVDTKEFNESEVITEEKFIGEMSLTVGDRVEGHENNADASSDNDAYHTDLSFSLVVTPGQGDDLVVSIVSGGEVLAKARIAGDGTNDGDSFVSEGEFVNDGKGNYTFKNLTLIENSGQTFSLNLEGAQYLEQGVYLFKSAGGEDASQTYVTTASGHKAVDLEMEIDLTFNVEEGSVKETRKWKKTNSWNDSQGGGNDPKDPTPDPEDPNPTPDPEDPGMIIPDEDVPLAGVDPEEELADIGDEEVPMADAPEEPMVLGAEEEAPLIAATGDSNHMTVGFGGMFAALAGMFFLRKKKEN